MDELQAHVKNLRRVELLNRQFTPGGITAEERTELQLLGSGLDSHHRTRYGSGMITELELLDRLLSECDRGPESKAT